MKYNDILGYFNGKEINLDIGNNLKTGLSLPTYIHEVSHNILNIYTGIGFLENTIKHHMELNPDSENIDLLNIVLIELNNFSCQVHEVFANTIEMIEIKRLFGNETWNQIYEMKPPEYKIYATFYKDLIEEKSNLEEIKNVILSHCIASLYIEINSDEFISNLFNPKKLNKYMHSLEDPISLLKKLKNNYTEYKLPINRSSFQFKEHKELLKKLIENTPLKTDDCSYLDFMYQPTDKIMKKLIKIFQEGDYNKIIEHNIKVFDLNLMRPLRITKDEFLENALGTIFIMKNIKLPNYSMNENEYFLVNFHNEKKIYHSYVGEIGDIKEVMKKENVWGISYLYEEYSIYSNLIKELQYHNINSFILIRDYIDASNMFKNLSKNNDIYYTSINENNLNGIITIFLFREKNKSNTLFVYPTTKRNMENIISNNISERTDFLDSRNFVEIFHKRNGLFAFSSLLSYLFHLNNHNLLRID